ncbi:helix-turn-helix domain-containing protein [Chryseobacterium caseinilyticum]|uniref:Helix-turn-helix domain-containing protein n=1 Tax=Chryseobacterium caseinilyticum TaxID=2771428 RepID=A0ABR8ZFM8_9FLAO|nr:helix-turn-helix domain-containing protein [Chryseobacterium caseinilyticum]MBD8083501.1 helix-turn-helix domain-containing protein [Chryseobacterium caseinilyticum]
MFNTNDELDSKKKEFGKIFFYSVAAVFAFYLLLSLFTSDVVIVAKGALLFAFFLTTYTGFIISKTKFDFFIIFRIIVFALAIFIIYMCLLLSNISRAIFFLFVPIIIITQILFSMRLSVVFTVVLLVLSFFITEIATHFNFALKKDFYDYNPFILKIQEYLTLVIAIYFSFFGLYYKNEFLRIVLKGELVQDIEDTIEEDKSLNTEEADETTSDKYQILYDRIINCFEVDKPFQDAEFNIRKLADLVDSNNTYVSRSLNQIGDKKFNQLVNEYRIRQVLEDLKNDTHQKFTIEHIYTNAGFSQQSTFNRIFKEQTGSTPSEYIRNSQK